MNISKMKTKTPMQALMNAYIGVSVLTIYLKMASALHMIIAEEQIRLAFGQSEKEVEDLHQRTCEGIETARLNGKQIGQVAGTKLTTRKSIKAKEIILKHSKAFNGSLSDSEVMTLA